MADRTVHPPSHSRCEHCFHRILIRCKKEMWLWLRPHPHSRVWYLRTSMGMWSFFSRPCFQKEERICQVRNAMGADCTVVYPNYIYTIGHGAHLVACSSWDSASSSQTGHRLCSGHDGLGFSWSNMLPCVST